jgi:hypothetical protein
MLNFQCEFKLIKNETGAGNAEPPLSRSKANDEVLGSSIRPDRSTERY